MVGGGGIALLGRVPFRRSQSQSSNVVFYSFYLFTVVIFICLFIYVALYLRTSPAGLDSTTGKKSCRVSSPRVTASVSSQRGRVEQVSRRAARAGERAVGATGGGSQARGT